MTQFLDVILDGPPEHDSGCFVEVEDDTGRSVSVGEWRKLDNGMWALRIPLGKAMGLRPPLVWFAQLMEEQLRKNDHKKIWFSRTSILGVMCRIYDKVVSLEGVARDVPDPEVEAKAADIANFAMIIATVAGKKWEEHTDKHDISFDANGKEVQIVGDSKNKSA